jgi:flagellar basal body P-ring protein FlgI
MFRLLLVVVLCFAGLAAQAAVRIKDVSTLQGVRDNQLLGYGLVVGLQGTGDTLRNSTFTLVTSQRFSLRRICRHLSAPARKSMSPWHRWAMHPRFSVAR